jgi:opacity protein-like surface antigen
MKSFLAAIAASLIVASPASFAKVVDLNPKSDKASCVTDAVSMDWGQFDPNKFMAEQVAAGMTTGQAWANMLEFMRNSCK